MRGDTRTKDNWHRLLLREPRPSVQPNVPARFRRHSPSHHHQSLQNELLVRETVGQSRAFGRPPTETRIRKWRVDSRVRSDSTEMSHFPRLRPNTLRLQIVQPHSQLSDPVTMTFPVDTCSPGSNLISVLSGEHTYACAKPKLFALNVSNPNVAAALV